MISLSGRKASTPFCDVKSPLPTPKFFAADTFSSKKNRRARSEAPPPTPRVKIPVNSASLSCRSWCRNVSNRAQSISFLDTKSTLSSSYDPSSDATYFEQSFEIICQIGSGSFGDVYKAKCKDDNKHYAVKVAKQPFSGRADRDRKLQEIKNHELLPSHPNCVTFFKAWEEKQRLYIQTELCRCSLSRYAEDHHEISDAKVWKFLIDLLQALKHLHDNNLVHLDIKPENIFISETGVCKLGDFGLVQNLTTSTSDAVEGDPRYLAPETMQGYFTKKADVFSLGITILELASDLDLPRGEKIWHKLREWDLPHEIVKSINVELVEVIGRMMEPDYKKRLSVHEILDLEVVRQVVETRQKRQTSTESLALRSETPDSSDSLISDINSSKYDDVFEENSYDGNSNDGNCSFDMGRSRKRVTFSGVTSTSSLKKQKDPSCSTSSRNAPRGAHCLTGSPRLPGSRKKSLSPGQPSPANKKSPRTRLFMNSSEDDDDLASLPPKNLLGVFNSLSPKS